MILLIQEGRTRTSKKNRKLATLNFQFSKVCHTLPTANIADDFQRVYQGPSVRRGAQRELKLKRGRSKSPSKMPDACKTPRTDAGSHPDGYKPGGSLTGKNHTNRSPPAMCVYCFGLT